MRLSRLLQNGSSYLVAQPALSDNFNRADSAAAIGTATTGQAWSNATGTHGISSNAAYAPTATVGDNRAIVDCGVSNCTVSATVTLSSTSNRASCGLIFRGNSSTTFLLVTFGKTGASVNQNFCDLYKCVAGAFTKLADSGYPAGNVNGTSYTLAAVLSGTSVVVKRNGTTMLSHTLAGGDATTFASGTLVGFRTFRAASTDDDGGSRYDNLVVTVP